MKATEPGRDVVEERESREIFAADFLFSPRLKVCGKATVAFFSAMMRDSWASRGPSRQMRSTIAALCRSKSEIEVDPTDKRSTDPVRKLPHKW